MKSNQFASFLDRNQNILLFWRLVHNRSAVIGWILICFVILVAIVGMEFQPYDPVKIDPEIRFQAPSSDHLLGTDHFGRDILSRILAGAHLSLATGFASIALATMVGLILGMPAGFFGGWLDMVTMRAIDVFLAFPPVLLALVIITLLGRNFSNVIIAVGLSSIPIFTRLVRACVLSVRNLPYIQAAEVVGCSVPRIFVRHILPNIVAPLIVLTTLGTGSAILNGATLSFLGLGAQPPSPEWGAMLSEARDYLRLGWWLTVFPGMSIALTVLALNLFGDGLRDVFDPGLQR